MFIFPGHFGLGLIICGITGFTGMSALLVMIGSILPDLDTIPYLFGVGYRKTHRTFTHSMFMPLITAFISAPLTLGIIVHLLFDLIPYPGVKLFFPFSSKEVYLYKGKLEKYHDPKLLIKDWLHNKRFIAFESSLLILGTFLVLLSY